MVFASKTGFICDDSLQLRPGSPFYLGSTLSSGCSSPEACRVGACISGLRLPTPFFTSGQQGAMTRMLKEHTTLEKKEEKKDEKKEEEPPEIVFKVDMRCEGCVEKVAKALRGFKGAEEVIVDIKASIVVRGEIADPVNASEKLQKNSGMNVELISPLPKPPEEEEKEEKEEKKEEEKKEEESPEIVFKVDMRCKVCVRKVAKALTSFKGVEEVIMDIKTSIVVKGETVDPVKACEILQKESGMKVELISPLPKPPEEEEKEEEEERKEENAVMRQPRNLSCMSTRMMTGFSAKLPPEQVTQLFSDDVHALDASWVNLYDYMGYKSNTEECWDDDDY